MSAVGKRSPSRDAIQIKADRAAIRSMGGDPFEALPETLDAALLPATAEPSAPPVDEILPGVPRRRYGPEPSYPSTPEAEQELLDKVYSCFAHGYSERATASLLEIPYTTIRNWCKKPYGAKLGALFSEHKNFHRGALEVMARDNLHNKDFNNRLLLMQLSVHHDEYKGLNTPHVALNVERPEAISQFEFERRLEAFLHRKEAERRGEIVVLPQPKLIEDQGAEAGDDEEASE
jgi:hypothetical protein